MTIADYFSAYQEDGRAAMRYRVIRDRRASNGWSVEPTLWVARVLDVYCLCWDRADNLKDLADWSECESAMRTLTRAMRATAKHPPSLDVLSQAYARVLSAQARVELLLSPGAREIPASAEWVRYRGKKLTFAAAAKERSGYLDRVIAKFEARQAKRLRDGHHIANGHIAPNKRVS